MKTIFIFQLKKDPTFILPCGACSKLELNNMVKDSPLYNDYNIIEILI